mgnify:CR=1 FL=1
MLNKLKNFLLKKNPILFIDSESKFDEVVDELKLKKIIAIDTEFDWRNTYFPKLSLIQISTNRKIFLIDCLKLNSLSKLKSIFENQEIIKIFHAVRSDAIVLYNSENLKIQNCFDIQIAERLLTGDDLKSYSKIVLNYLSLKIDKSETNSNWLKRPITRSQTQYAADDVRYLINIYLSQKKLLLKKPNLYSLVLAESEIQVNKGNQKLYEARLNRKKMSSYEKKIFLWREKIAQEQNTPISYVFKDNKLKDLSNNLKIKNTKMLIKILGDKYLVERLIEEVK